MGNLTVKESGEMVNIISPNVSKITSFKVHFSPKQEGSGDPSSENVRDITGWNGVEGYKCGKNLFNMETAVDGYINTTGKKIFTPDQENMTSDFIPVIEGETYTWTHYPTQTGVNYWTGYAFYSSKDMDNVIGNRTVKSSLKPIYITVPANAKYIRIGSRYLNGGKAQLEKGSIENVFYEPYQGTTTPIDWTEDVGTVYGGYVDLISGELVQEYASITLTGAEEGWQFYGAEIEGGHIFSNSKVTNRIGGTQRPTEEFCTHFPMSRNWKMTLNTCIVGESGLIGFTVDNSIAETVEEFTQFLAEQYANGTPVRLVYKIYVSYYASYTIHQLTPQQLSTLKGQNNFWSNADYIEIEYELTETFDIQKAKRKIILNQPHVESVSGDLVTFDTDMKGKLKECKVYFSPVQEGEGDPSPDNERLISGFTGCEVQRTGKNLLPPVTYTLGATSSRIVNYSYTRAKYCKIEKAGTYTISRNIVEGNRFGLYATVEEPANNVLMKIIKSPTSTTDALTYTFEFPDGYNYLFIYLSNVHVEITGNYQVEKGSTATTYEPYQATTTSIDWTEDVGTVYGEYVDLVSGELVVDRAMATNPVWSLRNSGGDRPWIRLEIKTLFPPAGEERKKAREMIICSKARTAANTGGNVPESAYNYGIWSYDMNTTRIYMPEGYTEADAQAYMENIQIVYPLAEPIHYQLTPQQILTLKGTNNVYSNTNGQTEIKYWTH